MDGMNNVQLVGIVGQDLKETKTEAGHRVAIRLATHFHMVRSTAEKMYGTTWHNVIAWDKQAEYAGRNILKGSRIMVEGRIVYGTFIGKDGQKRFTAIIRAHSLTNLDR